jgi:ferredoxin
MQGSMDKQAYPCHIRDRNGEMPKIVLHKNGQIHEGEVKENTNLVVRAGIKQFPYPNLSYGCGMGKCSKCACIILQGGEHLPAPNWKEKRQLGDRLEKGYRLACQIWISHDTELTQDGIDPTLTAPAATVAGTT